jgi:hypothetical protein
MVQLQLLWRHMGYSERSGSPTGARRTKTVNTYATSKQERPAPVRVQPVVSWRRYWKCHMAKDENGKRYWLPRCMGGAVYGKRGCTCDPDENERNHLNEYR